MHLSGTYCTLCIYKFEKYNAQFYKYVLFTITMYFEVGNLENIILNFTSWPYSPKMRIFLH